MRQPRLAALAAAYARKRDTFAGALTRHLSDLATWQSPPGGLFFWLRLKARIDTRELLPRAIARGVAFMPGEAFYPVPEAGLGTLRLNFSHASAVEAERGLRTLADLIREACAATKPFPIAHPA